MSSDGLLGKRRDLAGDVVFTPPDVSQLTLRAIEQEGQHAGEGVRVNLGPAIGEVLEPLRRGELISVIGRPSNFKTGTMLFIGRSEAQHLINTGRDADSCVVYVTWEQSVEEMTILEIASRTGMSAKELIRGNVADVRQLKTAAVARGQFPLWIMGHSISRRRRRPRLTMDDVAMGLSFIEDSWGIRPSLIILDYLQRIRTEDRYMSMSDRMIFSMNVERCKDMALAFGCPVILGVQAKREVDYRNIKIPRMGDGMETSNIEHSSDRIFSVMMPKMYYPLTYELPEGYGQGAIPVTKSLLLFHIAKQKLDDSGLTYVLDVAPDKNVIRPLEVVSIKL